MIYHILYYYQDLIHQISFYAWQDVFFRCIMSILTSFIISVSIGPKIIRWLKSKNIHDNPEFFHSNINELNKDKVGIPTMGGLIILIGIVSSTILWAKLNNPFIQKIIFVIIWFGGIGAVDDWLKLTQKKESRSRNGLKPWEKLVFQFGGAVLTASFLFNDFTNLEDARRLWLPFYKYGLPLANWAFIVISVLYISAMSNAANLTDGMDGLATGCLSIISLVLIILCYIASETMANSDFTWSGYLLLPHIPDAGELSIFYSALFGSSLGFLWFNCHKATVFMGDTGSLPLGASIGYGAIVTRHEILLFVIGGVFVIELLSVVLQVGYYKYSGGKRLFRIAPIHHHFHDMGIPETKIVVRFWIIAAIFALIALATLKIR